jgi:hypothetical protein
MKLKIAFLSLLLFSSVARAQVPATVHVQWTPNPVSDNVTQYTVTLDLAAAIVVLPTVCSPTLCVTQVTVPTFGLHTVNLVAQNLAFDGVTLQSSMPAVVSFTLAAAPVVVAGLKVTK